MKKLLSILLVLFIVVGALTACGGVTPSDRLYRAFTRSEEAAITEAVGEKIPFLPNDDYYFEDTEDGILFSTVGNTEEELSVYLLLFTEGGYSVSERYDDNKGVSHNVFTKGNVNVDISSFSEGENFIVKLLIYPTESGEGDNDNGGDNTGDDNTTGGDNTGDDGSGDDGNTGDNSGEGGGDENSTVGQLVTSLKNGHKVVIAAPAYNKLLSMTKVATHYNAGVHYSGPDFSVATNDEIFTVTVNGNGSYTFTSLSGKVLAMAAEYNSLSDAGTNNKWTLEAVSGKSGVYYVKNVGRGNYLEWYSSKDNWSTYTEAGSDLFEIAFYAVDGTVSGGSGSDDSGSGTGSGTGTTSYAYTDFTTDEKALFMQYIGEIIPFVANDEYYVEGWNESEGLGYEYGMCFYTFGNTAADFAAYRLLFSDYELSETYEGDNGDTWYCYIKGDVVVDVSFYTNEGVTVIDLYVYSETLSKNPDEDTSGGDSGSTGGDSGSGSGSSDVTIFDNEDAGMPEDDGDGVFDVDFTDADKVDDVTDQGYYLGGCPTTSTATTKPGVLVIPVQFDDVTATSRGFTIEAIENAFLKGGVCDYYSVYDYYYMSSMGQLELNIEVVGQWFTPANSSSYYKSSTDDNGNANGDQIIMDEALAWLDGLGYNLAEFDSDGNEMIDAVVLINTLEIGEDDFNWAYRYWNYYTDDDGYYYEYDGVSANDYLWASYQFLFESESGFDDKSAMNTYTFIHEFGHILGADDYYDTSYSEGEKPLDSYDIMDSMAGDHNAYTKINLGWITTSRLVTTDTSVTLTLESFGKNGDTIIIANDWDSALGAYQEYYIIVYYKNDGLNAGDAGYFDNEGILVYHVNATLYSEIYEGETYYDVYNNNTDPSDEYGTENNLIEYVASGDGDFVYEVGEELSDNITDDSGEALGYVFVVSSLDGDTASITFTKV